MSLFLVACTRLYNPLCPSVGRLVGRSVGHTLLFFMILLLWPPCSCPNSLVTSKMAPAHLHATSVAMYPALFSDNLLCQSVGPSVRQCNARKANWGDIFFQQNMVSISQYSRIWLHSGTYPLDDAKVVDPLETLPRWKADSLRWMAELSPPIKKRQPADFIVITSFSRVLRDSTPHFVRRLVCWSVGHTLLFHDFYFLTSLLLPKWSSDLKYGPCPPARDFGSRVSGLVFWAKLHFNQYINKISLVFVTK